jgi:hypothetical protein
MPLEIFLSRYCLLVFIYMSVNDKCVKYVIMRVTDQEKYERSV